MEQETREEANLIFNSLMRFPLIVALMLTREALLMTKALSTKLQASYVDIVRAHEKINLVKKQVKQNWERVETRKLPSTHL